MPLGNLTSQFFANLYLNELDQFVKHKLRAKFYIRYVDDFIILHNSRKLLEEYKLKINNFLKEKLDLELHPDKSGVIKLKKGINFLGFRIFCYHKLIRKSNLKDFEKKFHRLRILYKEGMIAREKAVESLEGWIAYASHGNTFKYLTHIIKIFNKSFPPRENDRFTNPKKFRNYIQKVEKSNLEFSVQKTFFFFKKGLNLKEITEKRGIKESTIWEHLANLVEHGQIPIWNIMSKKKIARILSKIKSKNDWLRTIRKRLNDKSISYDEIACVLAHVKYKDRIIRRLNKARIQQPREP